MTKLRTFPYRISTMQSFKSYLKLRNSNNRKSLSCSAEMLYACVMCVLCLCFCLVTWGFDLNVISTPGPNFIELLSTSICLAWNFFLDKNRITSQITICCILLGIQLLFAYPENHVEIWLVIRFLSKKKCHATTFMYMYKQFFEQLFKQLYEIGPSPALHHVLTHTHTPPTHTKVSV